MNWLVAVTRQHGVDSVRDWTSRHHKPMAPEQVTRAADRPNRSDATSYAPLEPCNILLFS
jgi:predicted RNA polymerase sigma factor